MDDKLGLKGIHMDISKAIKLNGFNRRSLAVSSLMAVCALAATGVNASGIPVVDGVHLGLTGQGWIAQYGQMYAEYTKQLEQLTTQINQLQTQVKQYQQMYVKGVAYKPALAYRENIEERFPERAIGEGVAEGCGSKPKNNPVGPQQYEYCVAIIQTQNRRYNAMRRLLKDVAENDKQLEAARNERENIGETDQGALQANTNKVASIESKMQNDIQNAKYTMDAYDAVLATLQTDMVRSAQAALNNRNELLGTAVQGAALKLALKAARSRDR